MVIGAVCLGALLRAPTIGTAGCEPTARAASLDPARSTGPAPAPSYERSVVAVVAFDQGPSATLCSGALVEPNLVLTAWHCVSKGRSTSMTCDSRGRSHDGAQVDQDLEPSTLGIYTGQQVALSGEAPRARGERLVHPAGRVLCDADIAYVVLDRPILDVPTLPVRGVGSVAAGDNLTAIGYGGGAESEIGRRVVRAPGAVLAIGPSADPATGKVLGPRELEIAGPTCVGDSGGPAIDPRRGDIVGVTSRGAGCTPLGNHVYTRVDAFESLTREARAAAAASPGIGFASATTPPDPG